MKFRELLETVEEEHGVFVAVIVLLVCLIAFGFGVLTGLLGDKQSLNNEGEKDGRYKN